MKQVASHLGGTTDPLIASWPAHIADRGAVRTQSENVTDIAPTIYAAAGITPPEKVDGVKQLPLEGASLLPSFTNANAPSEHTAGRIAGSGRLPAGYDEIAVKVTSKLDIATLDGSSRAIFSAKPAPVRAEIEVNGTTVAAGDLANVSNIYGETFDVGRDLGSPVSLTTTAPAPFTGKIGQVTLDFR